MLNSKYKHIIWDFNGTLLNDVELVVIIMNDMLSKRKLPSITIESYRNLFDFPVIEYYKKLGFDFEKDPFSKLSVEFIDRFKSEVKKCSLQKNILDTIKQLKDKNISQSVLSASRHDHLKNQLKHLDILKYFSYVSGLKDIHASGKKELAKEHFSKIKAQKEEILLIGDTVHDYHVSIEIGCDILLVANGHQSKKKLLNTKARVIDEIDINSILT